MSRLPFPARPSNGFHRVIRALRVAAEASGRWQVWTHLRGHPRVMLRSFGDLGHACTYARRARTELPPASSGEQLAIGGELPSRWTSERRGTLVVLGGSPDTAPELVVWADGREAGPRARPHVPPTVARLLDRAKLLVRRAGRLDTERSGARSRGIACRDLGLEAGQARRLAFALVAGELEWRGRTWPTPALPAGVTCALELEGNRLVFLLRRDS